MVRTVAVVMKHRTVIRSAHPTRRIAGVAVVVAYVLASCGSDETSAPGAAPVATAIGSPDGSTSGSDDTAFVERMDEIQSAVAVWREAANVDDATAAAEAAANLVVGPQGPGYGDRNGDGVVSGEADVGLLSGVDGEPAGIAVPLAANECVARDVLGGTAADVAAGWTEMESAIAAWRPDDNTMPSLASHPMRIVGWATFTIASDSLDVAQREYAGHAQLHVDVALVALDC